MESKNLDKAIEIYSKLISGEEICKKHPDNGPLYDEFYGNAEVYDIVMNMMKKIAEKPSTINNTFEKNSCNFNAGSSMNGDVRMNTQK